MTKSKRRHPERDFTPTHPHAVAIDIGSRMHVAAVPPDLATEPVRAFGTCTGDLRQLADWFEQAARRANGRDGVHRRLAGYLSTNCLSSMDSRWCWSTPATPSTCQDAKPTSVTPCMAETATSNMGCCAPASDPRASWPRCALICANVSAC